MKSVVAGAGGCGPAAVNQPRLVCPREWRTIVTNPPHPLDPLTAEEIRQTAAIVRRDRGVGPGWRCASIELREPGKDVLPALEAGEMERREAIVVCWDRSDGRAY